MGIHIQKDDMTISTPKILDKIKILLAAKFTVTENIHIISVWQK